jgi:hypothetical protein
MKKIAEFKVHSFIDIITNSSTEIFTISKDKLKENLFDIIETLTFIANADCDVREIFEIGVSNDGGGMKIYMKDKDWYEDMEKDIPDWLNNDPDLVDKMHKSLGVLFNLESVDYY